MREALGALGTMSIDEGTHMGELREERNVIAASGAKVVCLVGMSNGLAALAMLCASANTSVHYFELKNLAAVAAVDQYLSTAFGPEKRLWMHPGNSQITLPESVKQQQEDREGIKCDAAYVDGSKVLVDRLSDLRNLARLTVTGGPVLMADCNVDPRVGGRGGTRSSNEAYQAAIDEGLLVHEKQIVTTACRDFRKKILLGHRRCREVCVGKFVV
eukprot:TRINITY_DN25615_c0_g1_i5.p1 TRINITY_DN25615_c0_g1~~TRINITY_DN25615_c0_g1_i5.p1  ORF type:complete len:215 (+),score=49.17 TRINITY_DN25615_c0_g1_i5:191-835(+)